MSSSTDDMNSQLNNVCSFNGNRNKYYGHELSHAILTHSLYTESVSSEESSITGNPWVEETDLLLSTLTSSENMAGKKFLSHEYLNAHLSARISPRQYDTGISSGHSTGDAVSTPTSQSPQCLPTVWNNTKTPSPIPMTLQYNRDPLHKQRSEKIPSYATSPVTSGCAPISSPLLPLSLGWSSTSSSRRESASEERPIDSGYWSRGGASFKLVTSARDNSPRGVKVVTQGRQLYLPYAFLHDGRLKLHIVRGKRHF